ncbi:DEAD/DEAH box helicase family protein [Fibrella aestuarina]|uniref:DEAD/DEAH box helicase family protein n=1 Tax=Fibrella aestuarina TaxID=651143 RepID=UPI0002E3BB1F|nr:DEAD/DEAH box helicase family protein [Fibrella aestuarina]
MLPRNVQQAAAPASPAQPQDLYPTLTDFAFGKSVETVLRQNGQNPTALRKQFQEAHARGDFYTKKQLAEQFAGLTDQIQGGAAGQSLLDQHRLQSPEEVTPQYNSVPTAQAFFGSITNGLADLVEAVPKLVVAGAGLTGGIDQNQWRQANQGVEKALSGLRTYVSTDWQRGLAEYNDQTGDISLNGDFKAIVGTTGNLISYILPGILTMGGASLATGGARAALRGAATAAERQLAVNTLEGAASMATRATSASAFLQTFPMYQREAMQQGYDPMHATLYALPVAAVNALIETANMGALAKAMGVAPQTARSAIRQASTAEAVEALLRSGSKLTAESLVETAEQAAKGSLELLRNPAKLKAWVQMTEGLRRGGARVARGFVEQGIPEGGEEFWQSIVENGAKDIMLNLQSADTTGRFDDPGFGRYAFDSVYGTILGTLVGTVPGAAFQQKTMEPTLFGYVGANVRNGLARGLSPDELIRPDSPNRLKLLGVLDDKLQRGELTPDDHAGLVQKAARMANLAAEFADVDTYNDNDRYTLFAVSEAREGLAQQAAQIDEAKNTQAQLTAEVARPDATMAEQIKAQMALAAGEKQLGGLVDSPSGPVYQAELDMAARRSAIENVVGETLKRFATDTESRAGVRTYTQDALRAIAQQYGDTTYTDTFKPSRQLTDPQTGAVVLTDPQGRLYRPLVQTGGEVTSPARLDDAGTYVPAVRNPVEQSYGDPLPSVDEHVRLATGVQAGQPGYETSRYTKPDNSVEGNLLADGVQLVGDLETLGATRSPGKKKALDKTRALAAAYLAAAGPVLATNERYATPFMEVADRLTPLLADPTTVDPMAAEPMGGDVDLLAEGLPGVSTMPLASTPVPVSSPVAATTPSMYASSVDLGDGFSSGNLTPDSERGVYQITPTGADRAEYQVRPEAAALALSDPYSYLQDGATYPLAGMDRAAGLVTTQPGTLVRQGDKWKIERKATLQFTDSNGQLINVVSTSQPAATGSVPAANPVASDPATQYVDAVQSTLGLQQRAQAGEQLQDDAQHAADLAAAALAAGPDERLLEALERERAAAGADLAANEGADGQQPANPGVAGAVRGAIAAKRLKRPKQSIAKTFVPTDFRGAVLQFFAQRGKINRNDFDRMAGENARLGPKGGNVYINYIDQSNRQPGIDQIATSLWEAAGRDLDTRPDELEQQLIDMVVSFQGDNTPSKQLREYADEGAADEAAAQMQADVLAELDPEVAAQWQENPDLLAAETRDVLDLVNGYSDEEVEALLKEMRTLGYWDSQAGYDLAPLLDEFSAVYSFVNSGLMGYTPERLVLLNRFLSDLAVGHAGVLPIYEAIQQQKPAPAADGGLTNSPTESGAGGGTTVGQTLVALESAVADLENAAEAVGQPSAGTDTLVNETNSVAPSDQPTVTTQSSYEDVVATNDGPTIANWLLATVQKGDLFQVDEEQRYVVSSVKTRKTGRVVGIVSEILVDGNWEAAGFYEIKEDSPGSKVATAYSAKNLPGFSYAYTDQAGNRRIATASYLPLSAQESRNESPADQQEQLADIGLQAATLLQEIDEAIAAEAVVDPRTAEATAPFDIELANLQREIDAADRTIARLERENRNRLQTGDLFAADPKAATQSDLFAGNTTGLEAEAAARQAIDRAKQQRAALVERQKTAQANKLRAIEQAVAASTQQTALFGSSVAENGSTVAVNGNSVPQNATTDSLPAQTDTPAPVNKLDELAQREADLAARLKEKLRQMRGNLSSNPFADPELLALGAEYLSVKFQQGVHKFTAVVRDFVKLQGPVTENDLAALKSVYGAYQNTVDDDTFDKMDDGRTVRAVTLDDVNTQPNDAGTANRVEPDSPRTTTTQPVGTNDVQPADAGSLEPGVGEGIRLVDESGTQRPGDQRVSADPAATGRTSRANPIYNEFGSLFPADSTARSDDRSGSPALGDAGIQPDRLGEQRAIAAAQEGRSLTRAEKLALQQQAESIEVVVGNRANIDATLPYLMDGQREDVQFAEARLSKPDGYGVLFTNGTGTGKTFLGLGIIKRFAKQGKTSALVIVPNVSVMNEWVMSAPALGLTIRALDDMKDAGSGINVTTYANFAGNNALATRRFDLLLADEAHNLMQSSSADVTGALKAFQVHTYHPDSAWNRTMVEHEELFARLSEIRARIREIDDQFRSRDTAYQRELLKPELDALSEERSLKEREWDNYLEANEALIKENQGAVRPRAVFLSATPFAYRETIQWANGYLFSYGKSDSTAYNVPSGYEAFMVQHFGYRMRYNRLTQPDVSVDVSLMERNFNGWLQKEGVASARVLDIDSDYQRLFALTPSAVGTLIDEGLAFVREGDNKRYTGLIDLLEKRFNYLQRQRLLEAIKAKEAIPYIQQWLDQGKKVVVFYDYTEGGGFAPFHFENENGDLPEGNVMTGPYGSQKSISIRTLIREFYERRPDLYAINAADYGAPLDTLGEAFPQAARLKGGMSKTAKTATVKNFNDDTKPEANIILVNAAANAGWSGHDTTGRHPRVLVNLGLPTQPTRSIQQEGRIYRTGQHPDSNSMFVYFNTGTNWERRAFADTIAGRAGTAENLGMGEMARGLKQAFIEGFEATTEYVPSEKDGTGGKAFDRSFTKPISPWDQAKTYYFAQLKRTAKTKAYEGVDYFATPEPLGMKMVEWGNIKTGDRVNEPSAGHGAIARWVPEDASLTVIEPSSELFSKVSLVTDGRKLNEAYEDHNPVNKYQVTVMNPPYGQAGKTALEHVKKAIEQHSVVGSRVVALVPVGAFNTKFDKWLEEVNTPPKLGRLTSSVHLTARILLPGSTFGRAGTAVNTQVLVLDKLQPDANPGSVEEIDLRDVKDINELFDELETIEVPERPTITSADVQRVNAGRVDLSTRSSVLPAQPVAQPAAQAAAAVPVVAPQTAAASSVTAENAPLKEPVKGFHAKNQRDTFVVPINGRLSTEQYNAALDKAKSLGGYYSRFQGSGAIPGFQFQTAEKAAQFYQQVTGLTAPGTSATQEDAGLASMMDSLGDTSNPFAEPDSPFFQLAPEQGNVPARSTAPIGQAVARLAQAFGVDAITDPAAYGQALQESLSRLQPADRARLATRRPLAFRWQGKVYFSPEANLNSVFHEFGGLWAEAARTKFPDLYTKGVALVRDSGYFARLRTDSYYKTLSTPELEIEALETAIGDKGEQFKVSGRKSAFRLWLDELFAKIGKAIGWTSNEKLADAKLARWAGQVLGLMEGPGNRAQPAPPSNVPQFQLAPDPAPSTLEPTAPSANSVLGAEPTTLANLLSVAEQQLRNPPVTNTQLTVQGLKQPAVSRDLWEMSPVNYTDADKSYIKQIAEQTGFELTSPQKLTYTHPQTHYHLANGQVLTLDQATLANAVSTGFGQRSDDTGYVGRLTNFVSDWLKSWTNLITFADLIDDTKGSIKRLIHEPQLEGSRRAGTAKTYLQDRLSTAARLLAPFEEQLIGVQSYDFNPNTGEVVLVEKQVPLLTVMEAVALAETQQGSSPTGGITHVFDAEPRPNELYERDADGTLSKKLDHGGQYYDAARDRLDTLMLPRAEYNRLLSRFVEGNDAKTGEVEGYEALISFFNVNEVADLLEEENNALKPGEPFERVGERTGGKSPRLIEPAEAGAGIDPALAPGAQEWLAEARDRRDENRARRAANRPRQTFYYPIRVTGGDANARAEAQGRMKLYDKSGRLIARSREAKGIVLGNPLQTMIRYEQEVADLLEYGRLSENVMHLRDAIENKYQGPQKARLVGYLTREYEVLRGYRERMMRVRQDNPGLTSVERGMRRFTNSIFSLNLGLPAKQLGTAASAMGQGIIEDQHLRDPQALGLLAKLTAGAYRDAGVGASVRADGSDQGLHGGLISESDTVERPYIEALLGQGMDEAAKAKQLRRFGAVINRLLDSNQQHVGDVSFDDLGLNSATLSNAQKLLRKYDSFAGERLMSAMRRADRAPILYYVQAAQLQASAEGLQQNSDAWWDRVAHLTERVVSETYNTDSLAERTPMQLSEQFFTRMLGMYSSQQQKIAGLVIRAMIGYTKATPGTPEAKAARAKLLQTLGYGVLANAVYVGAVSAGTSVIMAMLSGGEPPEADKLTERVMFDSLRNVSGTFPGLGTLFVEYAINKVDGVGGNEQLYEVPSLSNMQQGVDAVLAAGRYMTEEDEKKAAQAGDTFVRKSTDFVSKWVGLPSTVTRVVRGQLTND